MINGERLQILQERMRALDPNEHEIYTFLGCEQAERINMKKVMEIQLSGSMWIKEA